MSAIYLVSDALSNEDGEAGQETALAPDKTQPSLFRRAPALVSNSNLFLHISSTRGAPPSARSPSVLLHPLLLRSGDLLLHSGRHRSHHRIGRRVR